MAPSTLSPLSSLLFSLTSIFRSTNAAEMANAAMTQLWMKAPVYRGLAELGYR